MPDWIDTFVSHAVSLGIGAALLEILRGIFRTREQQGEIQQKQAIDGTDLTRILLDHNQNRYESVLADLTEMRERLDKMIGEVRRYELENLHLRHLLGLGPEDTLPSTREEMLRRDLDNDDPLTLPSDGNLGGPTPAV